jgi:hypothetical protein
MNRSKVQTALNKVEKAFRELEDAVGDGHLFYMTNIGITNKAYQPDSLSRTYGNVPKNIAIHITEAQLDDLKDQDSRKATRQEYEEVARELLADIPVERLS